MHFCNDTCIRCQSKDIFPINFSSHHKACFQHLNELSYQDNANSPSNSIQSCIWCKSKVFIVWDLCRCLECREVNCKIRKCGHTKCMKGHKRCPECCTCKRCGNFDENAENGECQKCLNLPFCPECNKKAYLYKKQCSHFVCEECYYLEECKECDKMIICDNCKSRTKEMILNICQHKGCSNCYLKECRFCYEEEEKLKKICPNCGENSRVEMRNCKHEGCVKCKNYCKKCNSKCDNCGDRGIAEILMPCKKHYGCEKCHNYYCKACQRPFQPSYTTISPCSNCKQRLQLKKLECGHDGCLGCYNKINCSICEALPKKCGSCNKECRIPHLCECGNQICENCFCKKCRIIDCPNCHILCKQILKFVCDHYGCEDCKESGCRICPNSNKCPNCPLNFARVTMKCSHIGCLACINNCSQCPQNKKCNGCLNKCNEYKKFPCGHEGCNLCIVNNCTQCVTNKTLFNNFFCANCQKPVAGIILPCKHYLCDLCAKKSSQCLQCSSIKCCKCSSTSKNLHRYPCNHTYCEACFKNSKYCTKCYDTHQEKKKCQKCAKESDAKVDFNCGHFTCLECYQNIDYCEFCCKKCSYCSKFVFPFKILSCNQHYACEKCFEINGKCGICMETCSVCDIKQQRLIQNDCGHKICQKCKYANRLCRKCPIQNCAICKSNDINLHYNSCAHKICNDCIRNRLLCNECFPVLREQCSCCNRPFQDLKKLGCDHKACDFCLQLNKKCSKCANSYNQQNPICMHCRKMEATREMVCNHKVCNNCFNNKTKCQEENNKDNEFLCNSCKNNNPKFSAICDHLICEDCKEETGNCAECVLKKNNNICPHCLEHTKRLRLFSCKHYGCENCMKNPCCYNCYAKKIVKNNIINQNNCFKCNKISEDSILLMCTHSVCSECFNENFKHFRNMCPGCAMERPKKCLNCSKTFVYDINGKTMNIHCCHKKLCLNCFSEEKIIHQCIFKKYITKFIDKLK